MTPEEQKRIVDSTLASMPGLTPQLSPELALMQRFDVMQREVHKSIRSNQLALTPTEFVAKASRLYLEHLSQWHKDEILCQMCAMLAIDLYERSK